MTRRALLAGTLALLLAAAVGWAPDPLAALHRDFLAAVSDEHAVARGIAEVERLRPSFQASSDLTATLDAYEGALLALRAKHAAWPPARLRHLRQGLAALDAVVDRAPDHAMARYLRLMSCYSLPSLFGRKASVRADFAALARLLPAARDDFPAGEYRGVVEFVLENGELPAAERARLEAVLAAHRG